MTLARIAVVALCLPGLIVAHASIDARAEPLFAPGADIRVNLDRTGSQAETAIAVNPRDQANLVAVWRDFRNPDFFTGTFIGVADSRDRGLTWRSRLLALPPYELVGDPVVAADPGGTFHVIMTVAPNGSSGGNAFNWIVRSLDGGATWSAPVDGGPFVDKPWINADPATGVLYEIGFALAGGTGEHVAHSLNGGLTWSKISLIGQSQQGGLAQNLEIGLAGELYLAWFSTLSKGLPGVRLQRSFDRGATWDVDLPVSPDAAFPSFVLNGGVFAAPSPATAVDRGSGPHRGRIYVVWEDPRFGDPDIVLARSDDGGTTWSAPTRVNDDAPRNGADQFQPWINVDMRGRVLVTFLDRRGDPANRNYALFLATSSDGGATFRRNIRVSDGFFPAGTFPTPDRVFVGDYNAAPVGAGHLHAIWSDARFGDQDVFTQSLDLEDYDEDGVPNDGDGDGQYASHPCRTRGTGCDDNCPGEGNPTQIDRDGDGAGDACDPS